MFKFFADCWFLSETTNNMSSKEVAQLIPIFVGQDFRSWKEKMTDYLGSQKLLRFVLGQRQ